MPPYAGATSGQLREPSSDNNVDTHRRAPRPLSIDREPSLPPNAATILDGDPPLRVTQHIFMGSMAEWEKTAAKAPHFDEFLPK